MVHAAYCMDASTLFVSACVNMTAQLQNVGSDEESFQMFVCRWGFGPLLPSQCTGLRDCTSQLYCLTPSRHVRRFPTLYSSLLASLNPDRVTRIHVFMYLIADI